MPGYDETPNTKIQDPDKIQISRPNLAVAASFLLQLGIGV
jgi:hypothetical protein